MPVLLTSWFKGKNISLAFGTMLSVLGLAAVLNSVLEPALASKFGVPTALWFAFGLQTFSFISMLAAVFLNKHAVKVDGAEEVVKGKEFKMRQLC